MSSTSFTQRVIAALKRLRSTEDRTRTTDYALKSNATAIENLTRAICKKRDSKKRSGTAVQQCLKATFGLTPEDEASQALKKALERLKGASGGDGR